MGRFRLCKPGQSSFSALTVTMTGSTLPENSEAGTLIGHLAVSGYTGAVTLELSNSLSLKVALDNSNNLTAGVSATTYAATPTLSPVVKVTAVRGGRVKYVTLGPIEVIPTVTPIDYTLRPTQSRIIDLAETLAPIPSDNWITVAVSGSVSFKPWTLWQLSNGQSGEWRKRELAFQLLAITSAAAESGSAGSWTLSWYRNAGDTGPIDSAEILFAVDDAPDLTWNLGVKTRARFGGRNLRELAATGGFEIVTQPTIDGQATPFEIWSHATYPDFWRLLPRSTNGTATTYGTTRAVTTIPAGALGTVTVRNLTSLQTWDFTVAGVAGAYDIAEIPPFMSNTAGNNQYYQMAASEKLAGEKVLFEDGAYGTSTELRIDPYLTARANNTATGVNLPSVDENDAGWVTFRSKNFMGATIGHMPWFTTRIGGLYTKFENLNFANGINIDPQSNGGYATPNLQYAAWVQVRGCRFASAWVKNQAAQNHHFFFIDNEVLGGTINMCVMQGRVYGNIRTVPGNGDVFNGTNYDYEGDDYSYYAWNYNNNCYQVNDVTTGGSADHVDHIQLLYNQAANARTMYATPGVYRNAKVYGNFMTEGQLTLSNQGGYGDSGQGFVVTVTAGSTIIYKAACNVIVTNMGRGITLDKADARSAIRNNTVLAAWGGLGTRSPGSPIISVAAGGTCLSENNLCSNNGAQAEGVGSVMNNSGTISSISQATATAGFADITQGVNPTATIQDIIDGYTTTNPAWAGKGAIGSYMDFRLRTIDPAMLADV